MLSSVHSTVRPRPLKLGFLPLMDCAPLIVAQEAGYFEAEGLLVQLQREPSWSSIRDKLVFGLLDGAHMLAPMPLACTLGLGSVNKPVVTGLGLGLNGNAMTLSRTLHEQLLSLCGEATAAGRSPSPSELALALRHWLDQNPSSGLTLASVFPYSMHQYMLRHWLSLGGIDPDRELSLVVVPPDMMVSALQSGEIQGYCVGEPYNGLAVRQDAGRIAFTGHDLWPEAPEKVFGVTESWADRYPDTHYRVIRALLRACQWLDEPTNRADLAHLLARPEYVGLDSDTLRMAVAQMSSDCSPLLPCTHKHFFAHGGTAPLKSRMRWIADQMLHWKQVEQPVPDSMLDQVCRLEPYDAAAQSLSLPTTAELSARPGPVTV